MQINLNLPPDLHQFVESKVQSGEFANFNEVIRHAIEEMREDDEKWDPEVLAYYRREVDVGLEQARRGELADFTAEDVITEGRARLKRESGA